MASSPTASLTLRLLASALALIGTCIGAACTATPHAAPAAASARHAAAAHATIEAIDLPRVTAGATAPLVILDVRSEAAYAAGHLPNAVRVDHATWESDSLSEESGLDNAALWRSRFGELGIDGRGTVVVYDGGSMTDAARIWFILQSFGAADVRVVNGGFPLIQEAARAGALSLSEAPSLPRAVTFAPAATGSDPIAWIGRQDLRASIDDGRVQILDARTIGEFEGKDRRGNARTGHLPGAVNVPHTSMLDARGRLKSPEELAAIFEAAGLAKGELLVTHCQGGGRAALAALAAARAGYGPVINYYLSFGDWSSDATCPVVAP